MSEPTTEAGKRLLSDLTDLDTSRVAPTGDYLGPTGARRAILAIEAESRADCEAREARLREALDSLPYSEPLLHDTAEHHMWERNEETVAYLRAALSPEAET